MESKKTISADNFANLMGVSKATQQKWEASGTFVPRVGEDGKKFFLIEDLLHVPEIAAMATTAWDEEIQVKPRREFTSVELFAGGGGLALGMEKAGFHHVLLNEFDPSACETLRRNRPNWHIVEGDVARVSFKHLAGQVDFLSGGFPCQAFSYAGKSLGFEDTRGTLFFQLARAVKEIQPKVFMGENVRGLLTHDGGKTLEVIRATINELGYTLVEPRVLKAISYNVPQKRERLILIAIRNDYADRVQFHWPSPYHRIVTLRDAFFAGELYDCDVPDAPFQKYPEKKRRVMELVPEGGDWRDLPLDIQKEYMGGSFYLEGGKTGMARRLSLDEPSLTLTCAPAQKQTERCHPTETRPLTVREYARIQTFPDDWQFAGNLAAQYKQIGNAVPVNLAWAVGRSVMRLMNDIDSIDEQSPTRQPAPKPYVFPDEPVQLMLAMEPQALYLSKADKKHLVGSCRQGNRKWIKENRLYNYPVSEEDLEAYPQLLKVKALTIMFRKKVDAQYPVDSVEIVTREQLAEMDYPVKSSHHKANSKYLLCHLGEPSTEKSSIDFEDFDLLLGKGVKR